MTAKLDLLQEQIEKAGYLVGGVCYEDQTRTNMENPATFFPYDVGFVRVDWIEDKPEQSVLDAIQAIITAHDPSELSTNERKDAEAVVALTDFANMTNWATWTALEISDWIEENVNDLDSAKQVLKKMAMAIIYLRNISRV